MDAKGPKLHNKRSTCCEKHNRTMKVYYLYRQCSAGGEALRRIFSLISPEEWGDDQEGSLSFKAYGYMNKALTRAVASGGLKQVKGVGTSGSFNFEAETTTKPTATKCKAKTQNVVTAATKKLNSNWTKELQQEALQWQKQAIEVLRKAQQDNELHSVECKVKKEQAERPNFWQVYYLYGQCSAGGEALRRFFSLISPEEWGGERALERRSMQFLGAYRLEFDQTWSRQDANEAPNSNRKMQILGQIDKFLVPSLPSDVQS
uniref:H15 domain-containing protein n=1 Tax=Globodera rostochiensis TaxID=31243 RepID=A0A914I9X2_GLORO